MIDNLINQLDRICKNAEEEISSAASLVQLSELHTKFLGRKGLVAQLMSEMRNLSQEEKPKLGQKANIVKNDISKILVKKEDELQANEDAEKIQSDKIDVSLPGTQQKAGGIHPLTQTINEIIDIFVQLGFTVEEGKEIEDEWHTFDALNIPKSHPARDVQDTFFVKSSPEIDVSENQTVLRTHTSPVQIRVMQNSVPPLKFIAPGRVYRNETIDASHYSMFHQVEGLYVNENVTFAELKGTLLAWAHAYYGPDVDLRFRPSYFPFTEPSAEVDVTCTMCGGKGCSVCKQTGWVEILGAGMVHPNVFKSVGYDPEKITGFAFGMGPERIAMLKHRINDIRLLYENDTRFLKQFV
ncbi:MAG: phenylalanine--tRNA ligase subunit alpha [Chlamydiae bacterium]|nr:MAG: phenylalanine--tRNA ligase subunit alpha [Chlamydiota bacterium]